jgi:hypothetical protein
MCRIAFGELKGVHIHILYIQFHYIIISLSTAVPTLTAH